MYTYINIHITIHTIHTYTYTQHLKNTNIQEHIHVYQPMEGGVDAGVFAAPFHTDNGLLLMVTPFQVKPFFKIVKIGRYIVKIVDSQNSTLIMGFFSWSLLFR